MIYIDTKQGNVSAVYLQRLGMKLTGLRTLDPLLSPPSTLAEIFQRTCLGDGRKLSESLSDQLNFSFFQQKKSASVDGGLSRGSSLHRPGSEDPHRR